MAEIPMQEAIRKAQVQIQAIPFGSWPNEKLKEGAMDVLAALEWPHDDQRRNAKLAEGIAVLSLALGNGLERQFEHSRTVAQSVAYLLTGELHQRHEIENPERLLLDAVESHQKEVTKL